MILKGPEIRERLEKLKGWDVDEGNLKKIFRFKTFKQAVNFVNQAAYIAEKLNHHPDILVKYDVVVISVFTHDEGGITKKDFELARQIEGMLANKSQTPVIR